MVIVLLAFLACVLSIIALAIRGEKRHAIAIVFSAVGVLISFIAIAVAVPRNMNSLCVDYLGIIVAILGAFATLLLGMQLYTALNLKEDAKKVEEARRVINHYATDVANLKKKINDLGLHITENPEWFYIITDANDKELFGIKRPNGSIEWKVGIPTPIKEELEKLSQRLSKLECTK